MQNETTPPSTTSNVVTIFLCLIIIAVGVFYFMRRDRIPMTTPADTVVVPVEAFTTVTGTVETPVATTAATTTATTTNDTQPMISAPNEFTTTESN